MVQKLYVLEMLKGMNLEIEKFIVIKGLFSKDQKKFLELVTYYWCFPEKDSLIHPYGTTFSHFWFLNCSTD